MIETEDRGDGPWRHGFATANGVRFHFVEAGDGPLLLLLHGFPECWYSWRHQIPVLARRFRVVAPDLRGYNETAKSEGGYDLASLATDVVALAGALGAESFHLAGHDWGGVVAWAVAASRPEAVERLAILNAPHPTAFARALHSSVRQMLRSWYIGLFQIRGLAEWAIRANDFAILDRIIRGQMVHPERLTDEDMRLFKSALARPRALESALAYYRAAFRTAARDGFAVRDVRIATPTIVVWGEQDAALGVELLDGLDRWVPDLRIARIPSASHWVQQDEPEMVTRLLADYFDAPTH